MLSFEAIFNRLLDDIEQIDLEIVELALADIIKDS